MISFWDQPFDGTAPSGEGPTYPNNPWDTVFANGKQIPGICKVKCEPKIQITENKAHGNDGATLVLGGHLPGRVEIDVLLWTADQWDKFQELLPILWRKPYKADKAVVNFARRSGFAIGIGADVNESTIALAKARNLTIPQARLYQSAVVVTHPAFDLLSINSVVVEGISTPEDGAIPQSKTIRLLCRQYMPPKGGAPTRVKHTPQVSVVKELQFTANGGGESPSNTDTGPRGAKQPTH